MKSRKVACGDCFPSGPSRSPRSRVVSTGSFLRIAWCHRRCGPFWILPRNGLASRPTGILIGQRTGIRPRTTSPNKAAQRASDDRGALRAPQQSLPAWGIERTRLLTYISLTPDGDVSALGSYGEAQCRNLVL